MNGFYSWLFVLTASLPLTLTGQTTFPVQGIPDERSYWYVFRNATLHLDADREEQSAMVIKDGRILALVSNETKVDGAVSVDLSGMHIYPSFVDLFSDYGISEPNQPENSSSRASSRNRSSDGERSGAYHWNEALKSDFNAHSSFEPNEKVSQVYREIGFGATLSHRMDGLSRGTSALVTLGKHRANDELVGSRVAHHLSFKKGTSKTAYPGSLMGCIALLRQTYLDGQWYEGLKRVDERNLSLEAWNDCMDLPQFFDTRDWLEVLRARKLGDEFGASYFFKGNGDEYRRIHAIKALGTKFILPLDFPDPFKIENAFDAAQVSYKDMLHWEWAPANPGIFEKEGIPFALTTHGLEKKSQFFDAIRKAIAHGLSPQQALRALTIIPAQMIGYDQEIGSLDVGKRANFIITSGPVFEEGVILHENWINGKPYVLEAPGAPDLRGKYQLNIADQSWDMEVRGSKAKRATHLIINDSTKVEVQTSWAMGRIDLKIKYPDTLSGKYNLTGFIQNEKWSGRGTNPKGDWVNWSAVKVDTVQETPSKPNGKNTFDISSLTPLSYPFLPYGFKEKPTQKTFLIRNATVWTNEASGILEKTDLRIEDGRIKDIGKNLPLRNAIEIDGTGKHVTCGIIDEHSHIAISRGVNECTQENTAEVRIGDVVNSEDINIYRALSGGVTSVQLLHGSCNPIGGQSAIIKMRWGALPEEMKFANAPGFIKFALGENVKRGNDASNSRYPNTRMGVEQVYQNAFTKAREYQVAQKDSKLKKEWKRDLELETMAEILESKRFISCHSYVQSEINMLMHVADSFGFKVNTFTHILEGYKVADKMARHGAGASSFSDWWAYKLEVYDAIPYNGAILHNQGVLTAFNSDDAEMARRLNQEAAKAVMYGGLSEEDAWKFVTLNPAKLLRIDDRVGSLKQGKDADVVIWSDHPLSVYAKAEKTFVDGMLYFDREQDLTLRDTLKKERQHLINSMTEKGKGKGRSVQPVKEHHYHCDDSADEVVD